MAIETLNHAEKVEELQVEQFKGQPRFSALLQALAAEVQEVEDATFELIVGRALATASGAALERLGRSLGQRRLGFSDEDFRRLIAARIQRNISQGEPNRLIAIACLLLGADVAVLHEIFPGKVEISVDSDFVPTFDVRGILDEAALAGVRVVAVIAAAPDGEAFAFEGSTTGEGWGTLTDPTIGGKLSHLL